MAANMKYSNNLSDILGFAGEEAQRCGNNYIGPEHLLLGIIRSAEGNAYNYLANAGVDPLKLKKDIEFLIRTNNNIEGIPPMLGSTERILRLMEIEARSLQDTIADSEHLLLAILRERMNMASDQLKKYGVTYNLMKSSFEAKDNGNEKANDAPAYNDSYADNEEDDEELAASSVARDGKTTSTTAYTKKKNATPALDNFGTDYTKLSEEGKLDPVIGRTAEIERLAQILSRRKKNNPVLIGEPGVGKSAIVEGLACRIMQHKAPPSLSRKRIVGLDMAGIVAGTKYRGQFEERLNSIIKELENNPDIILFIDEIHTIIGAGGSPGSLDAANMLKPALAKGLIQCIGATTLDEYRQSIEKDGALERRFQKIMVKPTTKEETLEILRNIKERYEEHHNVRYTDAAIEACVNLSDRYISDRQFPDKAIDAMDEAGARAHIRNVEIPKEIMDLEAQVNDCHEKKMDAVRREDFKAANEFKDLEQKYCSDLASARDAWEDEQKKHALVIDEDSIAEVISLISGVPVQKVEEAEYSKLRRMPEALKSRVIGQDKAIDSISKAILRNRIGLKDPAKPIGSFLFLGPTGVGKTYLTKILADYMFNSPNALIRIDMSEYMEKFTVSRLVGAPPGYVGYEEGGQLTEKVRRNPYSIVLFDEIEKAHADVFNLLLQVLDEGRLTDSLGRTVDFRNTIIIMTSNAGSRQLKDFGQGVGFSTAARRADTSYQDSIINKALQKTFSPEFLNRIDETIIFEQLSEESIFKIIDIELRGVKQRISALGYNLELSEGAKKFIASKGYDSRYGARPLKRTLQKYVEDEVAGLLVNNEDLPAGSVIRINYDGQSNKIECNCSSMLLQS